MASGTVLIAFVPGYATIGLLAPVLVLIGRLLQGFSAGVELGGVSVYLVGDGDARATRAFTSPGSRPASRWRSWSPRCSASRSINCLTPAAVAAWGWRIPFFIGCMIVPFLFCIRRSLQETEEFMARKHRPTHGGDLRLAGRQNWAHRACRHDAGGR